MKMEQSSQVLETAREKLGSIVTDRGLLEAEVAVSVSVLTSEEAIGRPTRRDFPILKGVERVIEASISGARGHAYTDSPRDFRGTVQDVLALPLSSSENRAVFIATLNAVLRSLGMLESSVHCKDDDPEKCAKEIAAHVFDRWGKVRVGLIGLNPAIAEALVAALGEDNVGINDLNPENIGSVKFGVKIGDGRTRTRELIHWADGIVMTGTTLVNGTFDDIREAVQRAGDRYLIYGITAAGVCELMGWNGMCPYGARTKSAE